MTRLEKWHIDIRFRDEWTCQVCGFQGEGQSHHVYGRVGKLKYMIDNGIYLCGTCHGRAHDNVKGFREWFEGKYPERKERIDNETN